MKWVQGRRPMPPWTEPIWPWKLSYPACPECGDTRLRMPTDDGKNRLWCAACAGRAAA